MKLRTILFITLCATPLFSFATSHTIDLRDSIPQNREIFTRDLREGMRGDDVRAIQKILNKDAQTRLSETGAGSLGYETDYFGPKMRAAIVRFQEKYEGEILTPAGMTQGSGYIGFYTKSKLNMLFTQTTSLGSASKTTSLSVATSSKRLAPVLALNSPATTVSKNPDPGNLDKFLSIVEKSATKQGLSPEAISFIRKEIIANAATTTEQRANFLKMMQEKSPKKTQNDTFAGKMLAIVTGTLDKIFKTEHAQAAIGLPFGGAVLGPALVCNSYTTWLVAIEPLPPSYPALLTYLPFTQVFSSYNAPITSWLLGAYEPGAGICYIGVPPYGYFLEVQGLISPEVGSSVL